MERTQLLCKLFTFSLCFVSIFVACFCFFFHFSCFFVDFYLFFRWSFSFTLCIDSRRMQTMKKSEKEWEDFICKLALVGLKNRWNAYITWHFSLILALEPSPPSCETPPFARSFFFGLDFLFFLPSNCSETVRVFSIFSNSYENENDGKPKIKYLRRRRKIKKTNKIRISTAARE